MPGGASTRPPAFPCAACTLLPRPRAPCHWDVSDREAIDSLLRSSVQMAVVAAVVVALVSVVWLMEGGQVPGGRMRLSSSITLLVASSPGAVSAIGWRPNTMTLLMSAAFLANEWSNVVFRIRMRVDMIASCQGPSPSIHSNMLKRGIVGIGGVVCGGIGNGRVCSFCPSSTILPSS